MKTIHLDQNALSIARRLAEIRSDSFSHDTYESTALGKSSFDVHLLGAKAEVAASLHYNLLVDMKKRLEGDEHDFEIEYDGQHATLDVKATTYRPAWLQVRETKTESDYYLATFLDGVEATSVELVGWSSQDRVLDGDFIRSPGGGSHRNYRLWKDEMAALPAVDAVTKQKRSRKPVAAD